MLYSLALQNYELILNSCFLILNLFVPLPTNTNNIAMKRCYSFLLALLVSMAMMAQEALTQYLFVYFPSNTDENIYYALSDNGFDYTPFNNGRRVIACDTVSLKKGLRDPHILRTDDGWFLMVATDMKSREGWESNRGLVLMKSRDLINWQHSYIHFPDKYKGKNFANVTRVWAPETIYDPVAGKYMVYYSILTNDGTILYDKVFYNYANDDFTDLEGDPTLLFDRGASTIDMDIVLHDGVYHAFYKNENDGGISKVTATQLTAPAGQEGSQWSKPSGKLQQTDVPVEGAGVFQLNDGKTWVLMYDCYTSGYYQFCTSTDLEHFTFKQNTYTSGAFTPRHGTVIPLSNFDVDRLQVALESSWKLQVFDELIREVNIASQLGVDVSGVTELIDNNHQLSIGQMQQTIENLKLAEYEYVTTNYTDDQTSLLGKWNTSNQTSRSGQHYDGSSSSSYWEQRDGWGNTSWSMSMKQTVTLPAGNYVLKCAGRSASSAVVATMTVDGASVNFPTKGDVGYGIDTSGLTNYSSTGEYANGGKGRGWEWRYLTFTLEESREVTISLSASVNNASEQWVSMTSLALLREPETDAVKSVTTNTLSSEQGFDLSGRPMTKKHGIKISKGKKFLR